MSHDFMRLRGQRVYNSLPVSADTFISALVDSDEAVRTRRTGMRKLTASMCLIAASMAVTVMLAPARVDAQSNRPTVALLDLEFGTVQKWWDDNYDIGKGLADLIVDAMLEDGSFRVFERKKLASVLGEQDLANSNRADPDAKMVAKLGKVAGVKY